MKKQVEITKWGITLTPRQWATYRLLRSKEDGDEVRQWDIYFNYPYLEGEQEDGYKWSDNPNSHDHCTEIWKDINAINNNLNIHKIIICKDFKYHIATSRKEVEEFIYETYYKPAMAKLSRYSVMRNKCLRNGQCKLVFKEESKARDFWETFIQDAIKEFDKSNF